MTIIDAITRIDALKFNTYSQADKIDWLSGADWRIFREVLQPCLGDAAAFFCGYDENTPPDTQLLVPPPFDELYLRWMEAQIDYHNGEYNKYNNSVTLYNRAFSAYQSNYLQNHKTNATSRRFLFLHEAL